MSRKEPLRHALLAGCVFALLLPALAEARGNFSGHGGRMNVGGGGTHGGHGGFNAPHHAGGHASAPHHSAHHPAHHPSSHHSAHHPPPHHGGSPDHHHDDHHHDDHHHGYPPPAPYWPGYWDDDDNFWWGAAAGAATAIAIGSIVASVPPDCQAVQVAGVTYKHCGSTWLQPEYQGHKIVYVVVDDPR